MFITTLNPSENRIFEIQFENDAPTQCEAPDFLQAFSFWLAGFDANNIISDLEIEIAGGTGGTITIWIGTQQTTIKDVTEVERGVMSGNLVNADGALPIERKGKRNGKRRKG